MPLVLMAALIVLQVAFVVRDQVAVVHAAREAARAASVDPDSGRAARHRLIERNRDRHCLLLKTCSRGEVAPKQVCPCS